MMDHPQPAIDLEKFDGGSALRMPPENTGDERAEEVRREICRGRHVMGLSIQPKCLQVVRTDEFRWEGGARRPASGWRQGRRIDCLLVLLAATSAGVVASIQAANGS